MCHLDAPLQPGDFRGFTTLSINGTRSYRQFVKTLLYLPFPLIQQALFSNICQSVIQCSPTSDNLRLAQKTTVKEAQTRFRVCRKMGLTEEIEGSPSVGLCNVCAELISKMPEEEEETERGKRAISVPFLGNCPNLLSSLLALKAIGQGCLFWKTNVLTENNILNTYFYTLPKTHTILYICMKLLASMSNHNSLRTG